MVGWVTFSSYCGVGKPNIGRKCNTILLVLLVTVQYSATTVECVSKCCWLPVAVEDGFSIASYK